MSATNGAENSLLLHWFNNTAYANFGDAAGLPASAAAGNVSISLSNTTGLAETDTNPTTNEGTYTGYARQTVARASGAGGWTVSGTAPTQAANVSAIVFGNMTAGGPVTEGYVGLSFHPSGTRLDLYQALTANLVVNNGVNPQFAANALQITVD